MLYNCGGIFFISSFFIGYILYFSLVRLGTIRLSAQVGTHIERRCSRLRMENVTITDVIIRTPDRKWTGDVNDIMPRSDGLRILGDFWKKTVSWDLKLDEASWFSNRGEARPVGSMRCATCGGVRWNSQHRKIVSLSPRDENLKVKKVIKVLYLNYRESSVFQVFFGFLSTWTFHVSVYLYSVFYVSVSWICYNSLKLKFYWKSTREITS